MTTTDTPRRYYVEYLDGSYAVCSAYDADDALNMLTREVEMAHGPVEGEPPADAASIDDMGGRS